MRQTQPRDSLEQGPASELEVAVLGIRVEQKQVHRAVRHVDPIEGAVQGVLIRITRQHTIAVHVVRVSL